MHKVPNCFHKFATAPDLIICGLFHLTLYLVGQEELLKALVTTEVLNKIGKGNRLTCLVGGRVCFGLDICHTEELVTVPAALFSEWVGWMTLYNEKFDA
jgi:hypothetical protein